jgi:DNA/RNA-binding domain of Phe-tRNA-synthetase-like protein
VWSMTSFRLADDFLELFPEARIGLVFVTGINNRVQAAEIAEILARQITEAASLLPDDDIAAHPAIAPWREAYARFGVKPSKTRSSIENLLRSAKAGRLRSINPLVDLYNSVSLSWQLPVGGEDLNTIVGDIVLTRADGTESFTPLGTDVNEPPPAGAVIYRDDLGVICSCWNWREADRTKLTEATTRAVLVIESIPPLDPANLDLALDALANRVVARLGGAARTHVLSEESRSVSLGIGDPA